MTGSSSNGGAVSISINHSGARLTFANTATFKGCSCNKYGGAIYITTSGAIDNLAST